MPIKTGKQYVDNLDRARPSVWINGEKVNGKISDHIAFKGLISTQAAMYDMQWKGEYCEQMTYVSPTSGDPVGLSFLQPRSKEELIRRRIMMSLWAETHHGFLGRAPDYMNTALMAFSSASEFLSEQDPRYAENMRNYYIYCRENDITLSHAFVQPHIGRFSTFMQTLEEPVAARVIEKSEDGIVVSGAFLLATQGVTAEEILVFPPPLPSLSEEENPYAFIFAVPNNLPGIKFICRENFVIGSSRYNYPLSSQFEEMDTLVIFDRVLIPHNRVFLYGDDHMVNQFLEESCFHTQVTHQILCRTIAKTEFLLGTIEYIVKVLRLNTYAHIIEKVSEVIAVLETMKSLLLAAEDKAVTDSRGTVIPDPDIMFTANFIYPRVYPRIIEILQLIGASGLIMLPSEKDFYAEISEDINKYLRASDMDAKNKGALFRLAWEMSANSFGGRQALYERFFFGDAARVAGRLYNGYSKRDRNIDKVKKFLSST
ncbi:4-hydroxyphenylacetate 3-monooxygenase, oxygenase component [Paenibacillus sedimenti]|uniref:4-hydroxyphenylacetate 3-monooxygenase, oxygenase component n=1 Tax=Paenibacillus sedimenti TaxID=2770274 RepID=A0A926KU48_9BACL|nr:4-hydroxyphenylacetate 3-monooxygenase, oxygenase component [Paenibacillus sedimenti]MBD0384075.1 4-hydroxyphenylacetate 3-monooxygenase, oxygenase component [Paenibacillus sedimenti]